MTKDLSVRFTAPLLKFEENADKTGWTYIEIPAELAQQLKPSNKKMFQVKGKLDAHKIAGASLLPMGNGAFILPINARMRKGIGKKEGATVAVELVLDNKKYELNKELMACIEEEQDSIDYFKSLAPSHQNYFSKWVDAAKTDETKTKRIARILHALLHKWDYSQMIRFYKGK